jgi:hypothetical protein
MFWAGSRKLLGLGGLIKLELSAQLALEHLRYHRGSAEERQTWVNRFAKTNKAEMGPELSYAEVTSLLPTSLIREKYEPT